jgi:hypothetical protein
MLINLRGGNSSSHGKSIALGSVMGVAAHCIAVTPNNPNPSTPRAKEIVKELRSRSPRFFSSSSPIRRSPPLAGLGAVGSSLIDVCYSPPRSAGQASARSASSAREVPSSAAQVDASPGPLVGSPVVAVTSLSSATGHLGRPPRLR